MLCPHCSGMLSNSWTRPPTLWFCTGPASHVAGLVKSDLVSSALFLECLALQLPLLWELVTSFSFLQVALKSRTLTLFPSSAGLSFLALEGEREPQRTDQFSSPLKFSSHSQGPVYLPRLPAPAGMDCCCPNESISHTSQVSSLLAGEKFIYLFFASTVNPSTALATHA